MVSYSIQTTLDASGIAKLQAEIRNVETELQRMANQNLISDRSLSDASGKLKQLRTLISSAFNSNLGMLDITKFTNGLKSANLSLVDMQKAFSTAGSVGDAAFLNTVGRLGKLDTGIKSVSKTTEKLFNTIGNTVRWGVVASGFQSVLNSAHQTVQYVRDLDTSLTNIMMVTQQSKEQMNEFAQSANEAAKALSSTTVNMTDAALVFAQQGFNTDMSSALAERSTQLANISQQDTPTTSDQITTIMNAYDFTGDLAQIDAAMDSWANVANVSAADVEELATAAQKAASTANTTGVTLDQLNAQIATIESVTREAPENIGNALKTIYSRFADISMGNTLEDGVDLGTIAETLQKVGVNVLNDDGKMNNVGDIMEQLMEVWGQLDQTQQNAISTVIAGRYQLSRFQALMNRSDLYKDYLGASENAEGTADQMQEIYANSMEGRLNQLQATAEGIFNDIFNTDDFYGMIDALTTILDLTNQWVNAIGGGGVALQGLGAIATRVFSDNIAQSLTRFVQNRNTTKQQEQNKQNAKNQLQQAGLNDIDAGRHQSTIDFITNGLTNATKMSTEQQEAYNKAIETTISLKQQQANQEHEILQTQILMDATATASLEKEDNKRLMSSSIGKDGNLEIDSSGLDAIVPETMEKMNMMKDDVVQELKVKTTAAASDLEKLKKEAQSLGIEGGASVENFGKSFEKLTRYLNLTSDLFDENTQTGSELSSILLKLDSALGKIQNADGIENQERAMKEFSIATDRALTKVQELNAAANNGQLMDANTLYGKRNALAATDENINFQEGLNAQNAQSLEMQSNISDIVNVTGAISQLMFSWQSFQSLGSLWANSDTELGDKVLQTVMNLSINLPMLISSFATLNSISKSTDFSALTNSLQQTIERTDASVQANRRYIAENNRVIASSRQVAGNFAILTSSAAKANIGLTATAAKMQFVNIGAKAASVGVGMLNKALSVLGGPIGIALTLVASVIGGIASAVSAANEEANNAIKETANKAAEKLSSIQDAQSNFDSLYQSYQEGTASSSELAKAAESLNTLIDDQSAKAYAAAGNWDAYAASVSNAAAETAKANQTNMQSATWIAEKEYVEAPGLGGLTRGHNNVDFGSETLNTAWQSATSLSYGSGSGFEFAEGTSASERLEDLVEFDKSYQQAIQEATTTLNSIADTSSQAYIDAQTNLESIQNTYNQFTEFRAKYSEEEQALNEAYQAQADNLLASYINSSEFQYTGGTVDEYTAQVKSALEAKGLQVSDQVIDAFVTGMMNSDVSGAKSLATQSGKEAADENFNTLLSNSTSINETTLSGESINDLSSYARQAYDSLTDEQKIQLVATLDEGASTDEILAAIGRIQNQVNTEAPLSLDLEDPFANFNTEEGQEEYLEKYTDIDSDLLNTYSDILGNQENVESSYMDMAQRQDEIALESYDASDYKSTEEAAEALEELQEAAENTNDDVEDFEDTMKKLAAGNARASKSLEELTESFEDNRDIIENSDKSSLEYAEAVTEVTDQIAGLLNVDPDSLSEGFVTSAQTMENLQGIINGDQEALENLRASAAQDIIQNVAVTMPADTQAMFTENINGLLSQLDAMNLGVNISANLDDTGYVAKLNDMLANGQLTQEQLTNILSAAGYEGQFVTEEQTVDPPPLTYTVTRTVTAPGEEKQVITEEVVMDQQPYTAQVPVLKGATQKGGVSSIAPRSSGGGGGRGSRGGGGGGGGSGKSYEPKKKDPVEDELDRYERVNTMLEDAENRYERLNADRERLTGFDMADDMEKEVELLNRQIALHREKLEIQKEEAQELRDELSSQYGITFDAEGFITNYATTHDKLVNEVNSLINQYNNTTTEEGQEALEEQIEDAQDALDDFNETYQRYDELWAGDLQETLNTLEDLEDQIEDIRIEMMNTSIEAVDNLQDLQESLNEFNNTFEHFGEDTGLRDAELAASNLATYFDIANESASNLYDTLIKRANDRLNSGLLSEDERQRIQQDIAMWENARKQIGAGSMEAGGTGLFDMAFNNMRIIQEQIRQYEETGTSTIFGENSADLYDAAKEAYDQATGLLSDFEGHYEDLHDAILDMIDETAEKIEKRREQYENITDELDHQREIIELIHGDEAYNELNMIYDAQNQNYLASINEMQQTLDYWKELQSHMEEGSEEWEAINEQIMDTQSELNDLVEESLDNLQEKYENTVNNILDQWTSSAFGGTDLDWVAEEWELINRNADYYLDDVNAAYETQKLQGKYLEMLDQTDDLHIQQMITEQMKQQLGYLRDKEKLSEYDVAYANAQLEILQKRIALEEAQRNKSQMQLRRDSQGNYSYVYTADEGDVSAAEGDLLDAQNNAYNLSKEQMQQTQADSLSALQDAQQLLNDIWTNANLTLDEKTERTQTVIDSLKEYLAGTAEQLSESEKNIINDFIGMAEMMTDENAGRIEDVLEQVKDGNLEAFDIIDDRWSTALSNWLLNLDDFNISTDDSFSQLIENSVEFQENVDSIASEVNQDFSDMGDTIAGVVDQTKDLASATSDFINQLESDSGIILKYEDQLESMREKIADTTNEMRAYQQQVNQLQSDLTAKEQENANLSAEIDTLRKENESLKNPGGSGGGGGGSSFGGSGYSQSDLAWGIAQNIWTYGWAGGWGNDPTRSGKLTGAYGTSFARQVQDIINQNWSSGNLVNYGSDKFSSYSLIGYDTGGYTGTWDDGVESAKNGKLAYLHQKELVLNAADTENILKAVDIVRQMVQTLKSSAVADTFSNIANSVSAQPSGETVEQNVHITAEFPAANSAAEIESALLSLNERAIQYSFRKK